MLLSTVAVLLHEDHKNICKLTRSCIDTIIMRRYIYTYIVNLKLSIPGTGGLCLNMPV